MPWRKIKWRKIKGNHQSKAEITKERGKLALKKNQMEKNKRKSSIKGRDNEKERKTCPGEKSNEVINQSQRQ